MENEGRVITLEVNMDTLKEELALLRNQVTKLDGKNDDFREHVYRRMDDLRDRIDGMRDDMLNRMDGMRDEMLNRIDGSRDEMLNRIEKTHDRIDGLRDHVDALRDHTDRRFIEMHAEIVQLRRDHERLIYWVAGFTIANLVATTGWILKAAGVF